MYMDYALTNLSILQHNVWLSYNIIPANAQTMNESSRLEGGCANEYMISGLMKVHTQQLRPPLKYHACCLDH